MNHISAGWLMTAALLLTNAHAASPDDRYDYKLSVGLYRPQTQASDLGKDVNLRWRHQDSSAWLGTYREPGTSQWRAGWDTHWAPDRRVALSLLPSVQVASGGFAGGSIAVETGERWFTQVGLGRTNLRPYVNLNFDPNDAWLAAVGYRDGHRQLSLNLIRDNRLDTGQQHVHVTFQRQLSEHDRLTVDALRKHGRGDTGWVAATGATVTVDHDAQFLRLAYDPHQNFGPVTAWRLSGGLRF